MLAGLHDFKESLFKSNLFLRLGWDDVRYRYVRTFLGPLWLVIGTMIWVVVMGFVMSSLFGQPLAQSLPYIAAGVAVWTFIANSMNEAGIIFVNSAPVIQAVRIPFSFYVLRMVTRHFIIFLHNVVIILAVILLFHVTVNRETLLVIPALILLILNAIWVSLLIAMLNARFRDIQQIVTTSMTVLPFVTPVFWNKSSLTKSFWIADFNPFYHMLSIVRSPVLGEAAALSSWIIMIVITAVGMSVALWFFSRYKHRIIYWL